MHEGVNFGADGNTKDISGMVKQDEFVIAQSVVREQMAARFAVLTGMGLDDSRELMKHASSNMEEVTGPLTPDTYKYAMDPRALLLVRLNHQLQEAN